MGGCPGFGESGQGLRRWALVQDAEAHVRPSVLGFVDAGSSSTEEEGDLADVLRGGPADLEHPGLGRGDGRTVGGQSGGEITGARGAHPHSAAADGVDDLLDRAGGDDATAADHQEMVGGLRHLAHQVRGEEDGSSFGGQGTHELADPLHALGVEPVDRLVEDERPGVA